ncbi:DNA polymerase III subunit gamma and tau [Arcanobacterium ihumii]|uniref:DNA polymerase III subunit gamma and tau n=1 Tax=Arcanobacterium ihumii TaxID=2138162 RepID=UPI000F52542A|nr:DNA polymerase III subunit gamma and tau [Arcanobacterium ihumii]
MSIALYRRYRPQNFQEVIGQEHVTEPLMAALEAGRTTHAYLFSGPRGCGKTTSARILARCLNCAEYPTDTPCGKCESCRELARDGSGSLDVVELDAASHGGVDDARELREQAGFAPVRDRFKIFIIDEAHMVSNQGFNALLKLVEEPPPHVKFIFATTEPEKVIGTIRSRTHHYPFRLVPPPVLENYLSQLCAQEGITAGHNLLSLVVRAGTGSVRDTLSVLDQIIGGSDGVTLDYESAVALLGYTSAHLLDNTINAIANQDGSALFGVVDSVVKSGHDPRRFVEDLLQRLRDLVIIALAGESVHDVFVSVPDDQYALMVNQAQQLGARRASKSADLVNEALTTMAGATAPRLQLELLCARLLVSQADAGASVASVPASPVSAGVVPGSSAPVASVVNSSSLSGAAPTSVPGQSANFAARKAAENPHKPVSDPRHRPMPSFSPVAGPGQTDPVQAASVESEPVSADTILTQAEQGDTNPAISERVDPNPVQTQSAQVLTSSQRADEKSDIQPEPEVERTELEKIQAKWNQIIAKTNSNQEAARIMAASTGAVSFENNVIVVGFIDDESANAFNFSHPAIFALAHAVYDETGLKTRCEGKFISPERLTASAATSESPGDRHPKDDAPREKATSGATASVEEFRYPLPVEPDDGLEEEEIPEEDPIYDLDRSQVQNNGDPAGVLGALLDGVSLREMRFGVDSELSYEAESAELEETIPFDGVGEILEEEVTSTPLPPAQATPAPQVASATSPAPSSSNVPFFAQNMPAPPPLEPSFVRSSQVETSFSASRGLGSGANHSAGVTPQNSGSQNEDTGRVFRDRGTSNSTFLTSQEHPTFSRNRASDEALGEESEWDEVSLDDPEISQSNLVGINVVLDKFDAKVIEEIPHEAGM